MTRRTANAPRSASGKTILCIDDQVEFLEALCAILEREGHRVLNATNGSKGLGILERERVDLLLLDYCMPEMSAENILAEIRDPALQIVLLTGYATEKPPREMLDRLNIQGYCDKSRGPEEILLWTTVALRHGSTVKALGEAQGNLHRLISTCLVTDEEPLSFDAEMEILLAEAAEASDLERILVALAPARPAYLPPSVLEEAPPAASDALESLVVAAVRGGPWTPGDTIVSQLGDDLAKAISDASRTETTTIPGGTAVVPLHANGRWIGLLWVDPGPVADHPPNEMLTFFAAQIANRCLVHQAATIDPLTGLQTFPFWRQIVCRELRQAFRFGEPLSIVRITSQKLNDLRQRNPRQADTILPAVGRLLRQSVRGTDLVARGNERDALILLSHTGAEGAYKFAKLLSHRLEELVVPLPGGLEAPKGSLGVATLEPHSFPMRTLPKPMPSSYYALAEELLRSRTKEYTPSPDLESFPIRACPRTDWPDPLEIALAALPPDLPSQP